MGSGASTAAAGIEVISPRVEMTKKGPKNVVLDSAPLSDVGHGTIRYRYETPGPSVYDSADKDDKKTAPTGYFFHPKLNDYSELGDPEKEEAYKFIRVAKGPKRHENQNVYYVSGLGFSGTNTQVPPVLIENSKQPKKIYGHKYFIMTQYETSEPEESSPEEIITSLNSSEVKILASASDTILDIKRKLGHHFVCPLGIVHVLNDNEDELNDDTVLKDALVTDLASSVSVQFTLQ